MRRDKWLTGVGRSVLQHSHMRMFPVDVMHLVANNIYVFGIRGEGKSGTHRAAALMEQKRFDATLIHTHTFDMGDLPEAIRYAKDRVEDAIKVVVTNKFAYAKDIAAE